MLEHVESYYDLEFDEAANNYIAKMTQDDTCMHNHPKCILTFSGLVGSGMCIILMVMLLKTSSLDEIMLIKETSSTPIAL